MQMPQTSGAKLGWIKWKKSMPNQNPFNVLYVIYYLGIGHKCSLCESNSESYQNENDEKT